VIAGEFYELKSIGAIVGVQMLGVAVGGAIGPVLGGRVWDVTGSYFFAFVGGGICIILALILLAFMRAPTKIRHRGRP
jgi:MFS family permease